MSNSHSTITAARDKDTKAIAGVDKHFSTTPSLELGGVSYTPAELKAVLQSEIDAENQLGSARAVAKDLTRSIRTTRAKAREIRRMLRMYILTHKGPQMAQMFEDFGFVLKAKSTPTVDTKAKAKVKTNATRAARHTMGSKQKQAITGEVPATPATPKPA